MLVGMAAWLAVGLVLVVKWFAIRYDFDRALGLDVKYAGDWTGWNRQAASWRALSSPQLAGDARSLQRQMRQRRWRLLNAWPFLLLPFVAAGVATAGVVEYLLGELASDRLLGVLSLLILNAGAIVAGRAMWTRLPRFVIGLALAGLVFLNVISLAYLVSR